ncbi:MAG: type IV pilus modification protein PilV [Agarilytica sp.]
MPLGHSSFSNSKQTGASLIEILVALFVLAIGLLGLAAMQSKSLQFNHSAQMRTQATILAYDIIDRMRANTAALTTYTATGAANASHNCEGNVAPCGAVGMATADRDQWLFQISERLPGGDGTIVSNGTSMIYTVTVSWTDRDNNPRDFALQAAL